MKRSSQRCATRATSSSLTSAAASASYLLLASLDISRRNLALRGQETMTRVAALAEYARAFGFGEYTGIELSGESRGYVASPESKRKLEGRPWVNGDTLAAAIGQSSNLFTPLQMANYIATLANGGTRYETHLLKYVCASDYSSVLSAAQSVIAGRVEMSEQTYQTVMEGMSEVTENGTAHIHDLALSCRLSGKGGRQDRYGSGRRRLCRQLRFCRICTV